MAKVNWKYISVWTAGIENLMEVGQVRGTVTSVAITSNIFLKKLFSLSLELS